MRNLDEIMRKDAMRRQARNAIDDAILGMYPSTDHASDAYKIAHNNVKGAYVPPCLVKGIGTVNPPRNTSASDNCWNRGMRGRTIGVAPGTKSEIPTVRVIKADGTEEIKTASSFRGKRDSRAVVRKTTTGGRGQSEVARLTKPIQALVD